MNEEVKIAVVPPMPTDANGHELFGPEILNDDVIESLSDDVVTELLAILERAGY